MNSYTGPHTPTEVHAGFAVNGAGVSTEQTELLLGSSDTSPQTTEVHTGFAVDGNGVTTEQTQIVGDEFEEAHRALVAAQHQKDH
jgi:hypothetical protein